MSSTTETNELVSVVIPCYNYGRFLGEAIESALNQIYQPVEVIVVDDGSTDDTVAVARRYPVKLISQPNSGLSAAGNAGIRASGGAFVVRLDADDRLAPTYLEETLAALYAHPETHFAYTEVAYFGAATGTYPVEDYNPETLAERNYIHASALMRRSSFEAAGGYSPNPRRVRCEDWDLWLSFAERGMRGVLVRKPLLEYRRHANGSMVTFNLLSLRGLRREIEMTGRLHANHPELMAPRRLLARLGRLPGRLLRCEVTPRFAALLVPFYGAMLAHAGYRLCRTTGRLAPG